MGKRRDIRKIDPDLAAGWEYVLSAALRKSFARSPAYWVDLYYKARNEGPPAWSIVMQWQFPKQGETVEGHTPPMGYTSPTQAAESIESRVDKKINEDGWLFYSLDINPSFRSHAVVDYISESVKTWSYSQAPIVTEDEPATRAERFQQLQQKRKLKAEW